MQDPRHIHIKDFSYDLPDERIAKHPLEKRDEAKLLLYNQEGIGEDVFRNLTNYLQPGQLIVFNNTKVIYARLHFRKATGALIEVFCLEPHTPSDYQVNFSTTRRVTWTCLIGNMKKWKEGRLEQEIKVGDKLLTLTAERGGVSGTGFEVTFHWNDDTVAFSEILDAIGELPIPPYLNRDTEQRDLEEYQTVYSKIKGSVAAPTAGLHFTDELLSQLDAHGIERDEITLHVGAGTFKPVKSEEIEGHTMHSEWIAVARTSIEKLIAHGGQCIAVGTTSVRTLESLYYIGVILQQNPNATEEELRVPQWMPYEYAAQTAEPLTTLQALQNILDYLERNNLPTLHTSTQIMIAPSYEYHVVRTMITNFHQPQSTLLLLVSAFVKGDWRRIYNYALEHDFRFLSYGDGCLLNF